MLSGIFGNASEIDAKEAGKEIGELLTSTEQVERAFRLVRDLYIFTNKRLILVDKQGISGNKVEYLSIPYSKITRFAVETAGTFDRDSELRIWISSSSAPIERQFKKGGPILAVQRLLAEYVLA